MVKKFLWIFLCLVAGGSYFSFASAATLTCGSIGGVGGEVFAYNSSWYGHGCKITPSGNIDLTAVGAEISRIATTQNFSIGIYTDSSNKPGTLLASTTISSSVANCNVYSGSIATTTLTSGTSYWLAAVANTHAATAYICGVGTGSTVSDQDSSSAWSSGGSGGYYFTASYASSSSGGGGGGGSGTSTATSTTASSSIIIVNDYGNELGWGIFIFFFVLFGWLNYLKR